MTDLDPGDVGGPCVLCGILHGPTELCGVAPMLWEADRG